MWRRRVLVLCCVTLAALAGMATPALALTAPPNDNFAGAQVITGTSGSVAGNLAGATTEPGEPPSDGTGQPSIWYRWTAPSTGLYRFDATTGVFATVGMDMYTGTSVSALTPVTRDWCPPDSSKSAVYVLPATAGTTYSIALTGYSANVAPGATVLTWGPYTRPANDAFAAATALSGFDLDVGGQNCAASAETGEPLDTYTSRRTVWYAWTPTVTVQEIVPDVAQNLIVTIYSGSSVGALTRVMTITGPYSTPTNVFTAQVGTTYHIQVDSRGYPASGIVGSQPPFRFALRVYVPCNDAYYCAAALSQETPFPLTGALTAANVDATAETGEPAHAGVAPSHSLWWQVTPPVAATVTLSTSGSGIDTVLAVYTGPPKDVTALSPVTADDDSAGGGAARVSFPGTGGTTYWIAVDGKAGAVGQIHLSWQVAIPAPANDMFAAATSITGNSGTSSSYTWSATKEAGEPVHEGAGVGQSVWWRYTAPVDGRLHVETQGDYEVMAVYRGSSVSALTRVDGVRVWYGTYGLDIDVRAGDVLRIVIDITDKVYGPDKVSIDWTLYPPRPPNDDIGNAIALAGASGSVQGYDVGATQAEVDEPPDHWTPDSTVFYKWTAPSTGLYVFDTLSSDYDTALWVYKGWGTSLSGLPVVAIDTDAEDMRPDPNDYQGVIGADHTSAVPVDAVAGQVYTIVIDGPPAPMQGRFVLHWAPATSWRPVNDMFAAATALSGSSGSATGTFSSSTGEPGEPGGVQCCSIWYTWTAPASGQVAFWTGDDAANPRISVYTGGSLTALTPVTENEIGVATVGARVTFAAAAGTTYRIRLYADGAVHWPGTVKLLWGPPPPAPGNDGFTAAVTVSGASGTVDGTCQWAGSEAGEPEPDDPTPAATVWYRWTAPANATVSFWARTDGMSTLVAAYTGSRVDALTLVASTRPSNDRPYNGGRITFGVTAGVTYAIQVQADQQQGGPFHLMWSTAPPPHDNLANALPLSGTTGYTSSDDWSATTLRATAEPGEPRHDPNRAPGATVWYRWTAPGTGPVTFTYTDSDGSTVLAAYTGSAYGSLTQVAHTTFGGSRDLTFDAVAGTTYRIVADNGLSSGQISLTWSQYSDHVKPTGTVSINGGATTTNDRMVTLTLNGTDDVGVTAVLISNTRTLDLRDNQAGQQYTLARSAQVDGDPASVTWSLTDLAYGGDNGSGTKTVYVQWCDAQGNWSDIVSDTIQANLPPLADTIPPTGSVTINGGAQYTGSTAVSLYLPANDPWSGVSQVRLSNRPETSGGLLTYGVTRDWTVDPQTWSLSDTATGGSTTNGTRTVYAQFRDGAGNWSEVSLDTIVLDTVAPVAADPTLVPATGSTVSTSVPTKVYWSASDATSGVAGYQLEQSIDGGAYAAVSLTTPLSTSTVRWLAPGHRYQFRVRAVDAAGLWSARKYSPGITPALYQENSSAFTFSGAWTRTAVTGASGGYLTSSSQAGAAATFTGVARSIAWAAPKGPDRGKATVYVDGVAMATVDLYASSAQSTRVVFAKSFPAVATHTVKVVVAGTAGRPRVDIDAMVVLG